MIFGSLRRFKSLLPSLKHIFKGIVEKTKELTPIVIKKIKENAPAIMKVIDENVLKNDIVKEQVHELLPSGLGEKAMDFMSKKINEKTKPKLKISSAPSFLQNRLNNDSGDDLDEDEDDSFEI